MTTDKDHPHLTLVDPSSAPELAEEFLPLPYYPWDERPPHLPLEPDECATSLHLAHGDVAKASAILKVPITLLNRMIRNHPRLQRVLQEALDTVLARAASIPIATLFDPEADHRRLEWASTKVLTSRLAQSHPLAPAPPSPSSSTSLTLNDPASRRSVTFRFRTDADDLPDPTDSPDAA
jgi:hypothetical protein